MKPFVRLLSLAVVLFCTYATGSTERDERRTKKLRRTKKQPYKKKTRAEEAFKKVADADETLSGADGIRQFLFFIWELRRTKKRKEDGLPNSSAFKGPTG
jgi:hypothetical protein